MRRREWKTGREVDYKGTGSGYGLDLYRKVDDALKCSDHTEDLNSKKNDTQG